VEGKGLKVLITGVTGFAGSHLTEYLLARQDCAIWGVGLPQAGAGHIAHLTDRVHLVQGDLSAFDFVSQLIGEVCPDWIVHLAAQAAPSLSWTYPGETLTNNILSELNLFRALIAHNLAPRLLILGSGDEYGLVQPEDLPITETTPFRPHNPYAVSKIAQDYLAYQFFLSHRLPAIRVRPFNHIGPRQSDAFVVADFAHQIAGAEAGVREPVIRVGNLEAQRDFTDVRDMVRAYVLALEKGEPGEVYNIGSGMPRRIGDLLTTLLTLARRPLRVETDPQRYRPVDVPVLYCDSRKFRACTGWSPQIPFEQTLTDVLDYWRRRVADSSPQKI